MVTSSETPWSRRRAAVDEVVYPESDGQPMAENTKQYKWIVLLAENLDAALPDFVAGDLLWYPVAGRPEISMAPDVLVAVGRPKGHRGSYLQFREDDVPPTVVIEVLSPSNSMAEMARKAAFCSAHGVKEFWVIDPESEDGWALFRGVDEFVSIPDLVGWTSPTLGVSFGREGDELVVYHRDGSRFLRFDELKARAESEKARAESEKARAESEKARAESEKARADEATERARRLAAKLAALGVNPDDLDDQAL